MKIIDNETKATVVLQDGDVLIIQTMKRNVLQIEIKCVDGILIIDEMVIKKNKDIKN